MVAHKTVAVAAGLGVMGLHRNVIHPRFGNFVPLATVLVDAPVSALQAGAGLQPLRGLQVVRRRLPGGRHRQGRLVRRAAG
ncbi:hypothetical protein [Streptomyces alanosinicus]|uniref:Uncharacterized protein n=1 Tax=Streptomyces alanosinicus TaxID=68171 RepID=A0A919D4S4_9ACTN|nr:hypothetical protein [Streptomyces alanosinicus]GHE08225.1 hypothetical protein GCM10010339_55770 [Streptomyces alanosinicus]